MSNLSEEDEFMENIKSIKKARFEAYVNAFVDKLVGERKKYKSEDAKKLEEIFSIILSGTLNDNGRDQK